MFPVYALLSMTAAYPISLLFERFPRSIHSLIALYIISELGNAHAQIALRHMGYDNLWAPLLALPHISSIRLSEDFCFAYFNMFHTRVADNDPVRMYSAYGETAPF